MFKLQIKLLVQIKGEGQALPFLEEESWCCVSCIRCW